MSRWSLLALSLLLVACGASPGLPPAKTPDAAATNPSATEPSASTPPAAERPKPSWPAPSPACAAYAGETPSTCPAGEFNDLLANALDQNGSERDAALRCLERTASAPPGFVRALRAELAPRGCADVVIGDFDGGASAPRELAETLVALRVGAALFRSVREPPLPRPPFDKPTFVKHFTEVLKPWVTAQAHAVDELSQVGPRLRGYAKGIVAIEAGLADMRFVSVARAVELPEEMKRDAEVRETYLVMLEQALEPRVTRGRDAALVGLGELSKQGITSDARLDEARRLLSENFAGRRIDALDHLLLPVLPKLELGSTTLRLAAKLPAFYAQLLVPSPSVDDARLVRARLERGVPAALWSSDATKAAPEVLALARRGLFQLGQTYFWAEAFKRAGALATPPGDADAALVSALSEVLAKGPKNAASLMLGPTTLPPELRDTQPLDALAKLKGPVAGLAEFDAAYVRSLAPPANDPAFWKDEAARYQRAQKKLDAGSAKIAADLGRAASDTEKELRRGPKPEAGTAAANP